jgi:hypothetical protein
MDRRHWDRPLRGRADDERSRRGFARFPRKAGELARTTRRMPQYECGCGGSCVAVAATPDTNARGNGESQSRETPANLRESCDECDEFFALVPAVTGVFDKFFGFGGDRACVRVACHGDRAATSHLKQPFIT